MINQHDILNFWFSAEAKPLWFAKNPDFDQQITSRFSNTLEQARQGELWSWRDNALGRLAEIIVLDQFSRNIFRNQPQAFAQDPLALMLAQEAISLSLDETLNAEQRCFLYLPFMHSESKLIHQHALQLFEKLNNPTNLDFELKHKAIIDRFGRYPHRNAILGRTSSPEERQFLTEPNSHF